MKLRMPEALSPKHSDETRTDKSARTLGRLVRALQEEATEVGAPLGTIAPLPPPSSPFALGASSNTTLSDLYLTTVKEIPLELRAVLITISYTDLPVTLANALAQHAVTMGKESPAYAFAQLFWEGYQEKYWRIKPSQGLFQLTEAVNQLGGASKVQDQHIYLPRSYLSTMAWGALVNASREALGVSVTGGTGVRYAMIRGITVPRIIAIDIMEGGLHPCSWEDALRDVEAQRDADHRLLSIRVAMTAMEQLLYPLNMEYLSEESQKGADQLIQLLSREFYDLRIPLGSNGVIHLGGVSLGEQLVKLQERLTPERLESFGSMVKEYNEEWATAAFDWSDDGEESATAQSLADSLRNSPWSSYMEPDLS